MEVMESAPPGFMHLLRQLADEHHREVGMLSAEVARLQRVCDDITSNASSDTRRRRGVEAEPTHQAPPFQSGTFGLLEKSSIPDEGALTAAFSVAKEVKSRLDSSDVEKPDEDALDAALDFVSFVETKGEEEPLQSQEVDGFVPGDETGQRETLLVKENSASLKKQESSGRQTRFSSATLDSDGFARSGDISVDNSSAQANNFGSCRLTDSSKASSSKSMFLSETMGRWDKLIKAVKMKQAIAAMPGLSPVWSKAAEEERPFQGRSRTLQLDMLVATAAKASKINAGEGSEALGVTHTLSDAKRYQDQWICQMWKKSILHPTCRRRVCWDVMGIMLLVHDLIFIPMQVFEEGTTGMPSQYEEFLDVLDIFGASFWTFDITVSFRTGYYSAEGFVEMRPLQVAQNYVKTWLPLDLIIVCADWLSMVLGMSSASGLMRLGKTVSRFMRVFRLLRFLKMNRAFKEMMERINSEYVLQAVALMKTLVFIVVMNHYIACAWYGLGSVGLVSRWPDKFLVNYPDSFGYAYATSLHWSLTQFTPASMEVVPQNAFERFFVIVVIILALVAFSSFVSSITAAMTHIRQINAKKVELESRIRQFFSEHKISHGMASRVWHFLRKNRVGSGRRMKETDISAFKLLPDRIKEDLRLEIYSPILTAHPMFAEYGRREEAAMIKICNNAIHEQSLNVGEELFKHVDEVKHMLFVVYGGIAYFENLDSLDYAGNGEGEGPPEVHAGQWACEVCLWADKAALPGVFVTLAGGCEIIWLDAVKFQSIASHHGDDGLTYLAKYAAIFMDDFKQTSTLFHENEYADQDILFNRPRRVLDFAQQAEDGVGLRRSKSGLARFTGRTSGSRRTTTGRTTMLSRNSSANGRLSGGQDD